MTITTADSVIDFLTSLQGMDRWESSVEGSHAAVIDLSTGATIAADPEFPDGEMLAYERANGIKARVHTHKLVAQFLVRHATELSVTQGGTAKEHYQHISDHFYRKTGFGQ